VRNTCFWRGEAERQRRAHADVPIWAAWRGDRMNVLCGVLGAGALREIASSGMPG
jgi:hypothetical protein